MKVRGAGFEPAGGGGGVGRPWLPVLSAACSDLPGPVKRSTALWEKAPG